MTWLITINCYGTRLHDPLPLTIWERQAMTEPAYGLDHCRRAIVLDAIRDICRENGYRLFAAHVRQSHVHFVADCLEHHPAEVMKGVKRRASKTMNASGLDPGRRKRWARHGNVSRVRELGKAIQYVLERQGTPLEVFAEPF